MQHGNGQGVTDTSPSTVPVLRGARILLRPAVPGDIDDRHAVGSPDEFVYNCGGNRSENDPHPPRSVWEAWYGRQRQSPHTWHIEHEGRCIGACRLHHLSEPDRSATFAIGLFDVSRLSRGIGTEAGELVLAYAFDVLGLHRVDLKVLDYNGRAIRCYEKCGFRKDGLLRENAFIEGKFASDWVMSILEHEWRERVANGWTGKAPTAPPLPTLETERLILRAFRSEDAPDVFAYAQNPNVGPNAGWRPHATLSESEGIVRHFIDKGEVWAIEDRQTGTVIGSIGLHKDERRDFDGVRMLGYVLAESHWGRGLMTEAASRVLRHAFEAQHLAMVSVYHYPHNARSGRVILKCGFTLEGTLRMAGQIYDGTVVDEVCYSMTRAEYDGLATR